MPQLSSEPLINPSFGPPPRRKIQVFRGDTVVFEYGGQPPDAAAETPEPATDDTEDEQPD